jgi:chorismate dehydratase
VVTVSEADHIRVGRIDFVNSDPVYHGIETGEVEGDMRLVEGFPAALNGMLERGEVDIAPISSIEYARNSEEYYLLPDLSVSSRAEVGSVSLFSSVPAEDLDGATVALASTSATSVVLLKILLDEKYEVSPDYIVREPDAREMLSEADAGLVIGDHALLAARDDSIDAYLYDLGHEWREHTDERFVYAVWAVRNDVPREDALSVAEALQESKRAGYDSLDAIASELAESMGLNVEYAERYLRMLDHDFTPAHRRGLKKYYEKAERIGELEEVPEITVKE